MTRSSPKSFCRPSVTRKTPPSLPMSSPMRRTLGSFSMAMRRPLLMPLASVIWVIVGAPPLEAGVVGGELAALVLDERSAPRRRRGRTSTPAPGRAWSGSPRGRRRPARRPRGSSASKKSWSALLLVHEVGLEPLDRVAELPHLDLGGDAVLGRVVGGRVGAHPVGVGLDEGRALAAAGRVRAPAWSRHTRRARRCRRPGRRGSRSRGRAGRAGCGSAARWARRWPTGCSGRRTRPGRC